MGTMPCRLGLRTALAAGCALVLQTLPAAACDFCAATVTFSGDLSQCYLETFEDELRRASESGLPFHMVNLGACAAERSRAPNPMPDLDRDEPEHELDVAFLIEPETMICLRDELVARDAAALPIVIVDLIAECTDDGG